MRSGKPTLAVIGFVLIATWAIYRSVIPTYFFEDDFGWLSSAWHYSPTNWLHPSRYNHFWRPVVELYFFVGQRLFGCAPVRFHLASLGIHVLNTLVLLLFARQLTSRESFSLLTAALFVVQPGYVQAVEWTGAITDLLPALWYFLTLLLHARFLQRRSSQYYCASLAAFMVCLFTHESSATLLPMMILLELMGVVEGVAAETGESLRRRLGRYIPFAALLAGYLCIELAVNSRSYVVQEGHWAVGWHAVPHAIQYMIMLAVWERSPIAYVTIPVVVIALLLRGTPRARFAVLWITVTLVPASFFTWGNVSRYLYVPAAGFALLLAEGALTVYDVAISWVSARVGRALVGVLVIFVIVRFALFAQRATAGFRDQTRPFERVASALIEENPVPLQGTVAYLDRAHARMLPAMPLDLMAQVVYCRPNVRVIVKDEY